MTQDQCVNNCHQATSSNHSTNKQVSDDLNISKNSVVSNGVNGVEEFNVDVNNKRSEHVADVVVVKNCAVDTVCLSSEKVFTSSEQSLALPGDTVKCAASSNRLIDEINSECEKKFFSTSMTVKTHQNSNENIRDIIATSDQVNKDVSGIQLTNIGENVNNPQNPANRNGANEFCAIKKKLNLSKRESNIKCNVDNPEDPVERLNKLRASISSALSEVKGVLKQYSTEQSFDGENESISSPHPADDGPVRFRFVRKIRRRSAYSEEDKEPQIRNNIQESKLETSTTDNSNNIKDCNSSRISDDSSSDSTATNFIACKNELVEKTYNSTEKPVTCSADEHSLKSSDHTKASKLTYEQFGELTESDLITTELEQICGKELPATIEESDSILPNLPDQTVKNSETIEQIEVTPKAVTKKSKRNTGSNAAIKPKNGRPHTILKKDRRASIAAVEVNQNLPDKSLPQLELKIQRRPSDSGTLVKQPSIIKQKQKAKTIENTKFAADQKQESDSVLNVKINPKSYLTFSTEKLNETTLSNEIESSPNHNKMSIPQNNDPTQHLAAVPSNNAINQLPKLAETISSVKSEVSSKSSTTLFTQICDAISNTQNNNSTQHTVEIVSLAEHKNPPNNNISSKQIQDAVSATNKSSSNAETVNGALKVELNNSIFQPILANVPTDKLRTETSICANESNNNTNNYAIKDVTFPAETIRNKQIQDAVSSNAEIVEKVKVINSVNQSLVVNLPVAKLNIGTYANESKNNTKNNAIKDVKSLDKTISSKKNQNAVSPLNKSSLKAKIVTVAQKAEVNKSVNQPSVANIPAAKLRTETHMDANNPKNNTKDNAIKYAKLPDSELATVIKTQGQTYPFENLSTDLADISNVEEHENIEETKCDEVNIESSSTCEDTAEIATAPPKKKRKAKRKVVIRRIKRKLSKDDTFIHTQEAPAEVEVEEKEIEEKDPDDEEEKETETVPKQRKPCIKARQFEVGDSVMYAERFKKTQVKWKKATVIERITSISYKLDIDGQEKPAHISYIKKFTNRKVNFGGKEYLEIDYAQIEEDEEKERNYSIWNLV